METGREWSDAQFCYLTTTGRTTGRPHTIEIWFGYAGSPVRFFVLAGGGDGADWVRNLKADPNAFLAFKAGEANPMQVTARFVEPGEEETMARELLASKYQGWEPGQELSQWARSALVIALEPKPIFTTGPIKIPRR